MAATAVCTSPKAVISTTTTSLPFSAQLAQQIDARHARHLEVREHEVRRLLLDLAQRLESVGGYLHLVALVAEQGTEGVAGVRLVVDDEDGDF
jgi:hypothetical protein